MFWPVYLLFGALASAWLLWRYKNRRMIQMARRIPGPPTVPLFGNALRFMGHPEGLIIEIRKMLFEYGDVVRFWLGPDLNIVVINPDDLKVLISSPKTNVKGPQYKYMADILGGGILSGSGSSWRRHRKIANPNYGKRDIQSYNATFNSEVDLLIQNLRETEGEMDIYEYIVRTTSYTVCQTLIGLTRQQTLDLPNLHKIIQETPRLYKTVFYRMTRWYYQIDPIFWMTESYRAQRNFLKIITDFCNSIIELRMEKLKHLNYKRDLLDNEEDSAVNTKLSVIDRFILSNELNHHELVQETFTIFTSSQEASAKISSFLISMMAYHPECQQKLYAEFISVLGDKVGPVSDEDLRKMPYLDMVFKEVLRLFPIGALLQRTVTEDITINFPGCWIYSSELDVSDSASKGLAYYVGSGTIPAGSSLVAPIYQLHRDPRYWPNPDEFDPERFNPENTKLRNPNSYIPFSAGPMDCLGRYFGTKLIKTICVRVLTEFEVTSLQTYADLRVVIEISVKSVNGHTVILKSRKK